MRGETGSVRTQAGWRRVHVLFVCTGNSARSQMAEVGIDIWPLPDPAAVTGTAEEVMGAFRVVRDHIEQEVRRLLTMLAAEQQAR